MSEQETRAQARLGKKRDADDNPGGRVTIDTRQHEVEAARVDLDVTLPLLIAREQARRDYSLRKAAGVVAQVGRPGFGGIAADLHGAEWDTFRGALSAADSHDRRLQSFERVAEEKRTALRIGAESRVYGPGSPNSYYVDLAAAAVPGLAQHRAALERLDRYSRELAFEVSTGSAEGRRALQIAESRARESGASAHDEKRAMSSATSSGGSFVTPAYLESDVGKYNSYPPAMSSQAVSVPDPGHGLVVYLPAFHSAPEVAQQVTEGAGVHNTTPTAGYLSAPLLTFAGEVDVSQALFDRSGPMGIDQILHDAMAQQLETAVDSYVIGQALAVGGSISGGSSNTAAGMLQDVANAKAAMETANGTKLRPTGVFMAPEIGEWLLSLCDPNGRPLLLPTAANAWLPVQQPAPGYTGYTLMGTPVFFDGSIPATGSNAEIVLANMGEVFLLQSAPVARAIPETLAADLTVVIQLYSLAGAIVRHPQAVQVLSGNAYPSAPSFI